MSSSFTKEIMKDPLFLAMREKLSDSEKKELDRSVIEMLEPANKMHLILKDIFSTSEGTRQFSENIENTLEEVGESTNGKKKAR